MKLRAKDKSIDLAEPVVMGILDVTPDAFSRDGAIDLHDAIVCGLRIIQEGAQLLDVSGMVGRPGTDELSEAEELKRVLPVIERLAQESDAIIAIDTQKSTVAEAALKAGAHVVNDISGLRDPDMPALVARHEAGLIITHLLEDGQASEQMDLAARVAEFFDEKVKHVKAAGVNDDQIILDPGLGFGKNLEHNLALLRAASVFRRAFPHPLMMGASRKPFVGKLTGREAAEEGRIFGTVALTALMVRDGVNIVRAHDVKANQDAIVIARAIGQDLR